MTFKKFEKVLLLNGKHRLVLSNHKTSKGEGWRLRQEGSGTNLPTLSSVDKLVAEGFLQANAPPTRSVSFWSPIACESPRVS